MINLTRPANSRAITVNNYSSPKVRKELGLFQSLKCYLCEEQRSGASLFDVDHFVPGINQWDNLYLACPECNNLKRARWNGTNLLKPCDPNIDVEIELIYTVSKMDNLHFATVTAMNVMNQNSVNTADLLTSIYQGYTRKSKVKALDRSLSFTNRVNELYIEYFNLRTSIDTHDHIRKTVSETKLANILSKSSPWTMPLRSIVQAEPLLTNLFD